MNERSNGSHRWSHKYTLLLLALLVIAYLSGLKFEQYVFNPITSDAFWKYIASLFVISLFLERAVEVFITTWRGIQQGELENRAAAARELADAARGHAPNGARADDRPDTLLEAALAAEAASRRYKADTQRKAFLACLAGGVLISAVGVRVLYPLLSWDLEYTGTQKLLFNVIDIALTGGLLGGGSDGIHKLMGIYADFSDKTRAQLKLQAKLNMKKPE